MREKWKYTLMMFGEPSVTIVGISKMLMLFAGHLATLMHS